MNTSGKACRTFRPNNNNDKLPGSIDRNFHNQTTWPHNLHSEICVRLFVCSGAFGCRQKSCVGILWVLHYMCTFSIRMRLVGLCKCSPLSGSCALMQNKHTHRITCICTYRSYTGRNFPHCACLLFASNYVRIYKRVIYKWWCKLQLVLSNFCARSHCHLDFRYVGRVCLNIV